MEWTMSKVKFSLGALLLGLGAPAAAQDVAFSWGATLTSNYMSRGATQSDNDPAFQPWAEVGLNGFYAGIWASNVRYPGDPDFGRDRLELDLYTGYRFQVENFGFDLGYVRYLYDRSGDCCGELYGLVEVEAGSGGAFGGVYLSHSGGLRIADAHVGVRLPIIEQLGASALVGRSGGSNYGNIGVSYTVNPNVELDLRYHRGIDRKLVLSTSVSF
jgi:uncharacterized protein (TIGR02001 family)